MLVLYGDHLPNLDIENEDLITQDIYKSEYVIYTNYEYNLGRSKKEEVMQRITSSF